MAVKKEYSTSRGTPWVQRTLGVLPLGNWDGRNEGCLVLDDGSFWMLINRKQNPTHNEEGRYMWIGTASPEGCVQWSGDLFAVDHSRVGPDGAYEYFDDAQPIWQVMVSQSSNNNNMWVHDGENIYYTVAPFDWDTGFPTDDGVRIMKFTPKTGLVQWIAGGPTTVTTSIGDLVGATGDSHNGKSAQIPAQMAATCDREYIYWLQQVGSIGTGDPDQAPGMIIRRMSLTPPHAVSTLPGPDPDPPWHEGFVWDGAENPDTGMPNKLRPDFAYGTSLTHHGDYLYFTAQATLRRIPKAGGDIETLIYGFTDSHGRDQQSDYEESPNGAGPVNLSNYLLLGRPELEGLDPLYHGSLKVMDNRLFFINASMATFYGGYNVVGFQFAYFDLEQLEKDYESKGPQRVNRVDPQWTSIANTSHWFEHFNRYTKSSVFTDSGYFWGWRDGSEPIYQNSYRYFDINPKAAGWEKRIAFVHSEVCYAGPGCTNQYGKNNRITQVAAYLEDAVSASQYELTFQFTGDLLKGYPAAVEMKPAEAPEEVSLG